jgi:hypothetical protein
VQRRARDHGEPRALGGRRAIRTVVGGYSEPAEYEQVNEDRRLTAAGSRLLRRTGRLRVRVVMGGARPVVTTLRASPGALDFCGARRAEPAPGPLRPQAANRLRRTGLTESGGGRHRHRR